MKRTYSNILALAIIALFASACTQDALEPTPAVENPTAKAENQITIIFSAEDEKTKTVYSDGGLDTQYELYWEDGDAIGIYGVNGHEYPNRQYNLAEGAGQKVANFANEEVTWTANTEADPNPYRFYAYYPYNAEANANVTEMAHTKVAIEIPGVQVQSGPNSIKHVGKYRYSVANKLGNAGEGVLLSADAGSDIISGLNFKNVTSAFKFSPKNLPDGVKVTSVSVSPINAGVSFGITKGTMDLSKVEAGVEDVLTIEEGPSFVSLDIEGGLGNGEYGFLVVNPEIKAEPYEISYTLSNGKTFKRKNSKGSTTHTSPATGFDPSLRYTAVLDYNNSEEIVTYEESPKTSNCYIVAPKTFFRFDARFKGNSTTEMIDGVAVKAEAIWNTGELGSINYEDGFVTLQSGSKPSNALIAVKDESGKILWSWHIWVTPLDKTNDITINGYGTFMSLNLGALSATTELGDENQGLYYQWGRKDPMFAVSYDPDFTKGNAEFTGNDNGSRSNDFDNNAALIAQSIANPTTYYQYWTGSEATKATKTETSSKRWGYQTTKVRSYDQSWGYTGDEHGTKTIYDPCPVGYRVPTSEEMGFVDNRKSYDENTKVSTFANGLTFAVTGLLDNDIFLYNAGSYLKNNVSSTVPGEFNYGTTNQASSGNTSYNACNTYLWTSTSLADVDAGAVNVILSSSVFNYGNGSSSDNYLKSCGRAIPVRCIAE